MTSTDKKRSKLAASIQDLNAVDQLLASPDLLANLPSNFDGINDARGLLNAARANLREVLLSES